MIAFVILVMILLYAAEYWSKENALNGIEFTYESTKKLVEPDEEFELIATITNTSYRFVPFIKIEEILPNEIQPVTEGAYIKQDAKGNKRHISSIYLMPKSKLVRKVRMSIPKRGRYVFRGAELYGGDFLGISEKRLLVSIHNEVVVYPRSVAAPEVVSVIGGFMGDISVRRFIIEDPILTVGVREYTGREPMKSISWNHSARTGSLMVKQYDYTVEPSISVLMDVDLKGLKDLDERNVLIETVYSLTRTVCQELEEKDIKYDFITNATTSDAFSRWSYLSEGLGLRHFSTILEGLGRASYLRVETFYDLIDKISVKQDRSRSMIIITLSDDEYRRENISYYEKKTGGKVYSIYAEQHM